MDHTQSEHLLKEIYGASDFMVDQTETTLFGRCADCRAETSDEPAKE